MRKGGKARRVEGGLQKERGYLIVSDGQKGRRGGKFQSRVDSMVGGGKTVNWSVCKQRAADVAVTKQAVTFCLYCAVYLILDSSSFSCSSWCKGLPSKSIQLQQQQKCLKTPEKQFLY